jgi:hypothetical protein
MRPEAKQIISHRRHVSFEIRQNNVSYFAVIGFPKFSSATVAFITRQCTSYVAKIRCRKLKRMNQLFTDLNKTYDSFRREVSYFVLIEFGIHRTIARLITTCLSETYSAVRTGKRLKRFLFRMI